MGFFSVASNLVNFLRGAASGGENVNSRSSLHDTGEPVQSKKSSNIKSDDRITRVGREFAAYLA